MRAPSYALTRTAPQDDETKARGTRGDELRLMQQVYATRKTILLRQCLSSGAEEARSLLERGISSKEIQCQAAVTPPPSPSCSRLSQLT
ncbi:hypothetical protein NDU88_006486 [Pleurodeles waltl]|uniref:Uncharacterized protein n=1 Tax=Pleurodeles waltl TaxID=8319 RepID=A0AAV7WFT2_PLEWA|nr:hypothetical protein NDU88_006486 [Pleurodeles waltl]